MKYLICLLSIFLLSECTLAQRLDFGTKGGGYEFRETRRGLNGGGVRDTTSAVPLPTTAKADSFLRAKIQAEIDELNQLVVLSTKYRDQRIEDLNAFLATLAPTTPPPPPVVGEEPPIAITAVKDLNNFEFFQPEQGPGYIEFLVATNKKNENALGRFRIDTLVPTNYSQLRVTFSVDYVIGARPEHLSAKLVVFASGVEDTIKLNIVETPDNGINYWQFDVTGYDSIGSLELREVIRYGTPTSTDRAIFRFYDAAFAQNEIPRPAIDEDATFYVNDLLTQGDSGEVIDFGGDTLLLRGTVFLNMKNRTLRNVFFYDDTPRYNNRKRVTDYFKSNLGSNILLENIKIYGIRKPDDFGDDGEGGLTDIYASEGQHEYEHWISPHFELGIGHTYRIDVSGFGSGSFQMYERDENGIVSNTATVDQSFSLNGDTVAMYFQLNDPKSNLNFATDMDSLHVMVYGHVNHHYESEFCAGIFISGQAENIVCRNWEVYSILGDGFQLDKQAKDCVFENWLINGGNRQGCSVNGGINTLLRNVELYNTGRSGLDVEPYAAHDLVDGLIIRNFRADNYKASGYVGGHWGQIIGLDVDSVEITGNKAHSWKGGGLDAIIRNVKCLDFNYRGATSLIQNLTARGIIDVASGFEAEKVPGIFNGNNIIENFRVERIRSTNDYLLATGLDTSNLFRNGVLSDSLHVAEFPGNRSVAYVEGNGRLENVTVEDFETYFPNSITHDGRTPVQPTNPTISAEIADRFGGTGGNLTPGVPYFYRFGVEVDGVITWKPEVSVTLAADKTSLGIPIKGTADSVNGHVYRTFILDRGTVSGNYDTRFRIEALPTLVSAPLGARAATENDFNIHDYGDRVVLRGGNVSNFKFFGYGVGNNIEYLPE